MSKEATLIKYRKDYKSSAFFINECKLFFDIQDDSVTVKSELTLIRNIENDKRERELFLNGVDFTTIKNKNE